jgi:hypothetical protein
MGVTFLDDQDLGPAIISLMAGSDVRCAVAFWGTDAADQLFPKGLPEAGQIVCDISLGCTNPQELRALGAPANPKLKHLKRLHAKVYLSDRGAIVCSANASDNGIGFADVAGLVEAGVFIAPGSKSLGPVEAWFERIWKRSKMVDPAALARAEDAWKRRPRGRAIRPARLLPENVPSLLRTVANNPERFRGIGFVFTSGTASKEDRVEASEKLARIDDVRKVALLSPEDRRRLSQWKIGDLFTDWSEQDLDAWPRRFVCIHRPAERAAYWFYKRAYEVLLAEDRGVVFAERPKGLKADLGFKRGTAAMLANDAPLLDRLFEKCEERGHWLCENGESLAQLIAEVEEL